ncbi:MAG: DNA recombination protein RmuC [Thiotrichaceae bacterium]
MNESLLQTGHFVDNNGLFLIALLMLILGFAIAWVIYAAPLAKAQKEIQRMSFKLEAEERIHDERIQILEQNKVQLQNSFSALSQHALRENNAQFLQLAQETLMRFHTSAQYDLEGRKTSIDEMILPIQQALDQTRKQIHEIEKERKQSFGAVSEQLKAVSNDQEVLRVETQKLVTALRRPEVRGQWGEITLKRLVELAGMVEHCDFVEQEHRSDGVKSIRPDLIVKMPDSRELIIDAKTPLDAYLEASNTEDAVIKKREYLRHAKIVRGHVNELAAKRYWDQFDNAPDFVVLFVPGEQFLGAALEYDKKLLSDALAKNVILASPTSLIALLRSVAFGWKQVTLSENAEVIRDLGNELYKRVATFTEHMARLGQSLNNSVDHYNKALGSLERSVLPGARRFTDLGIQGDKVIPETEIIDKVARQPNDREG